MRTKPSVCMAVCLSLVICTSALAEVGTFAATASGGRASELANHATLIVHRKLAEPALDAEQHELLAFEPDILALLGPNLVEYEGMAVASMSEAAARRVLRRLTRAGYLALLETSRGIEAFSHRFHPLDEATRRGPWKERAEPSEALDGLAWVQFGYPIKAEWQKALAECGVEALNHVPERTLLVATPSLDAVAGCKPVSPYLAVVEPVLSTDRVRPETLDVDEPLELTFAPGVTFDDFSVELAEGLAIEPVVSAPGSRLAVARVIGRKAAAQLLGDARVLRIVPVGGVDGPSDERQAQILARRWENGVQGEPLKPILSGSSYTLTYNSWLDLRNLDGFVNQPTVAVFDTGVDNGLNPAFPSYHPDIANGVAGNLDITVPIPVAGWADPLNAEDRSGHGTHVIGTIIGLGLDEGRSPANTFASGQGINPAAKVLSIKRWKHNTTTNNCSLNVTADAINNLEDGHDQASTGMLGPAATIANHSWNFSANEGQIGWTQYEQLANRFEALVRDSSITNASIRPMSIVFAAGNNGAQGANTIGRPANAKNVVTVGAVDSFHPGAQNTCGVTDSIDGPFTVSSFSGRGPFFGVGSDHQLNTRRVKPDVMAPGWRVEGPRRALLPFEPNQTSPCPKGLCGATSVTIAGPPVYTYGRGTSFAAPAVSGAIALKSKQLRTGQLLAHPPSIQSGISAPMPTLLKAALIATAQSLGPINAQGVVSCTGGDCRPSYQSGWGLVDLDRLTDPATGAYIINESVSFSGAGQSWTSPNLKPADPSKDVLIALVWNDIPVPLGVEALSRDLDLSMVQHFGPYLAEYSFGNNFSENVVHVDNGYSHGYEWNGFPFFPVSDRVNNVEAIFLPPGKLVPPPPYAGQPATFRLTVSSFTHAVSSTYPQQAFSIYAWNVQCVSTNANGTCAP
jgi:subtilisin family serine protease